MPQSADRAIFRLAFSEHLGIRGLNKVMRAFDFAVVAHEGQERESGEPFVTHPINAAYHLLNHGITDACIIAAALLHDTVEDVERITPEIIEREFGPRVRWFVEGVTRLPGESREEFNNRIKNASRSVKLIRGADRLHNLETIDGLPEKERRERMVEDTVRNIIPIVEKANPKIAESLRIAVRP